tara:strand:- start:179 stop:370 length:192 start_codon:yes stop_codon:yes gene_type:complete
MRPSEILKQIKELNKVWREQNFVYTPEQRAEFDQLKRLRRERVKYFYENDLVFKGAAKKDDTK